MVHSMKPAAATLLCLACAIAAPARAQKTVPITAEPHHHLVYTGARIRTFRVEVPAHSSTLIHEHVVDYFWIALGASEFVNAAVGKPEAKVVAADGSVHFTRGGFSHLARVDGAKPFRNVTLELPEEQTHPGSLCELISADDKLNCDDAMKIAAQTYSGGTIFPAFTTDQIRVTRIALAPDQAVEIAKSATPPMLVALNEINGTAHTTCVATSGGATITLRAHIGDAFPGTENHACTVHNAGKAPIRFLAVEFRSAVH